MRLLWACPLRRNLNLRCSCIITAEKGICSLWAACRPCRLCRPKCRTRKVFLLRHRTRFETTASKLVALALPLSLVFGLLDPVACSPADMARRRVGRRDDGPEPIAPAGFEPAPSFLPALFCARRLYLPGSTRPLALSSRPSPSAASSRDTRSITSSLPPLPRALCLRSGQPRAPPVRHRPRPPPISTGRTSLPSCFLESPPPPLAVVRARAPFRSTSSSRIAAVERPDLLGRSSSRPLPPRRPPPPPRSSDGRPRSACSPRLPSPALHPPPTQTSACFARHRLPLTSRYRARGRQPRRLRRSPGPGRPLPAQGACELPSRGAMGRRRARPSRRLVRPPQASRLPTETFR